MVHFLALVAGVEDIDDQVRLLASGIGFFLRMDAVVLGFDEEGTKIRRLHSWHGGASAQQQTATDGQGGIQFSVAHGMEDLGYPTAKTLPLIHLGRIMGYVAVARRDPAPMASAEEFLLSSLQTFAALLLANYTERKLAEAVINRRNRALAGISTIFREALNCDTEEQLGKACLRVVEEATGSKFGFIGELGSDGLLHALAISDPGWEACSMARVRPVGNFKMHGIYGRVLKDGRSLLTNAPAQHPDSIGTPPGHPVLTAFLGVPLVSGERTMGMIGVGNREGGYQQAELETLEAMAPAVMEALHRKRTEQVLIRSEKLVSVGRLAATIAHEINNPLAAAMNALYLVAQDRGLSPRTRELAQISERELQRAAQIARRTLGFYREPNSRAPLAIADVISEIALLYEPRMRDRGVRMVVRCPNKHAAVIANSGEMRQLFSNLLANSIDAVSESGVVQVHIAGPMMANGAPVVRVSVADSGSGIEPQNLKRLFEPFFTTKKDVGTGLGLWIAEQILKKHGGSIRVRSRVGRGTVFSVRLPAAVTAANAAKASD